MKLTYVSACLDSSGYAEAARNNIAALDAVGIDVAVIPVSFEGRKANLGRMGNFIKRLAEKEPTADVQILHVTPTHYPSLTKDETYSIGYAAWETSRLPPRWAECVNLLDEVWVPSQYNVKAFKDAGVTVPVKCMPHTFDIGKKVGTEAVLENRRSGDFIFYSIFQWLERKNPIGLLRAYLTEFEADENVVLVLKTFVVNSGNQQEADEIRKKIQHIKKTLFLSSYPRMLLISSLLSRDQMASLHTECDCYTSLFRCEGFGIPIAEAMQAGNPVIVTGYSGPVDFVEHEKTGYLVDYMLTPVANMPWEMYRGDTEWAEPDLMQARQYMRQVFENRKQTKEMGNKAKVWMKQNLSWKTVGEKMKARLEEI